MSLLDDSIRVENLIVGASLSFVGAIVSCLNISVLIVLVKGGFLGQQHNGIYVLTFGNLIGDTIQQLMVMIYVGPSSIAQVAAKLFEIKY
jgi:hypothetical protein